jgi:hypothetical protein
MEEEKMNAADLSLFVFGIYLIVIVGFGFIAIPNTVLALFKLPETQEPWIRILGGIVALIGVYYIFAGLYSLKQFEWITVWGRFGVLVFLAFIAISKRAKPNIILLGVVDAAGAVWTLLTLI